MNLQNIVIVLSHPEESRNVGAVCRAMANNSIKELRIVGNKDSIDDSRVRILAIHASNIWDQAKFYPSITEATKDCVCAAGTTRRRGKKRKGKLYLPEEFADLASGMTDNGKAAIVFGNERTGLTDEELLECTMGVTIPSSDEFASLNLSHAVQILCYHMFRHTKKNFTGYTPITLSRLDQTVTSIADSLQRIGFFSKTGRPDMEQFWKTILSRASLSESEAQYLEKTFDKAAGLSTHNTKNEYPLQ
ncbi:MAG: RNA methyltransferase [Treponema sp.]|nr:RNA methyltransferase [Treponema sp.]